MSDGALFELMFTLGPSAETAGARRSADIMRAALSAATAAAAAASSSSSSSSDPGASAASVVAAASEAAAEGGRGVPFTLLVGPAPKAGAGTCNVLDARAAGRTAGALTVCAFAYGGEAVDEALAQRFAAFDVVCFSRFPNNALLADLQRLLRTSHRYCMVLAEAHFPATGVMLASKARITKTVVPTAGECYSASALDRLTRQTGGTYACKLDVSPIFQASFWIFHCLLFFHSFSCLSHPCLVASLSVFDLVLS